MRGRGLRQGAWLTAQLAKQMAKGAELDAVIREKLGAMGYEV